MPLEPSDRNSAHLWHIAEACHAITESTHGVSFEQFSQRSVTREAQYWRLFVISKAVDRLSDELKIAHPNVPWTKIRSISDQTIQDPRHIDIDLVWQAINEIIPTLFDAVQELMPTPPQDPEPEVEN